MKRMYAFLILVLPLLALGGCGQTSGNGATVATGQPTFVANFDPTHSIIPFPDDLLFTGSLDGTLNIPLLPTDSTGTDNPKVAMNTLDGFSTIAPISTTFATAANAATIIAGTTLHVYEVTATIQGAVTGIVRELTAAEYTAALSATDATGKTLLIQPRAVLKSNTRYMVVLTGGIKSTSGLSLVPSSTFGLAKGAAPLVDGAGNSLFPVLTNAQAAGLEPLRQLTQTYLANAAGAGVPASTVALAWTFKTQTINKVLARIQADSAAAAVASDFVAPATVLPFATWAAILPPNGPGFSPAKIALFPDVGSISFGNVNLAYYLSNDGVGTLSAGVLPHAITDSFTVDPVTGAPALKSTEAVPYWLITPKVGVGASWPVVIFQHGFTVDKSVVLGIANTLAKAGFAVIAIDSVLHGSRTFHLDLLTEKVVNGKLITTAAVPDGKDDSSGKWYLNIGHLLTTRDNVRQSVADLIHLTRLLELQTIDVVNNTSGVPLPDGVPDLIVRTANPISYVGHSNGGILGTMLAAVEPAIKTFVLANAGGIYSDIFLKSAEVGPLIRAGLASKGVLPGSPEFNAFFIAAQTVGDDGDPINYAALATAAGKNLLLFKQLDDLVVPNSSTNALAAALGLKQVAAVPATAIDPLLNIPWPLGVVGGGQIVNGFTFFTQGTHSSFLKPDPATAVGNNVITEMQSETAAFLGGVPGIAVGTVNISGAAASAAAITTIMQ